METECIRVTEGFGRTWAVMREPHRQNTMNFKMKSHAIAFARAVSFSRKLALFIDDADGVSVRQSSASLTYPTVLN